MTELSLLPAELADLSVAQLAALSPQQKILLAQQLDQAGEWLKQVKARFDAALEQTYGNQVFRHVLATPTERIAAASTAERARVNDMADRILPVSARAAGLRDDTQLGKRLGPYPLERIRAPTLVISARDDGFGTYAAAEYTASRIPGATFIGFEHGGHLLVGHNDAVHVAIVRLLIRPKKA